MALCLLSVQGNLPVTALLSEPSLPDVGFLPLFAEQRESKAGGEAAERQRSAGHRAPCAEAQLPVALTTNATFVSLS